MLWFLSGRQTNDKVGQLLGRGLVSKDNRPMKCTTSKLLIYIIYLSSDQRRTHTVRFLCYFAVKK